MRFAAGDTAALYRNHVSTGDRCAAEEYQRKEAADEMMQPMSVEEHQRCTHERHHRRRFAQPQEAGMRLVGDRAQEAREADRMMLGGDQLMVYGFQS